MIKMTIPLDIRQFQKMINQLNIKEKLILVRILEKDTWKIRFRNLLKKIDKRVKTHPISQKEINKIAENSRQRYYEKGGYRH